MEKCHGFHGFLMSETWWFTSGKPMRYNLTNKLCGLWEASKWGSSMFAPVLCGKNAEELVYISNTSQWGAKTRDLFPTMSYQSAMNLLFDMASLSDTFRLQGPLPCARPERSPCQLSCFWHPSPCPARYGKVKLMASSRASSCSKIKLQWCAQRIPKGAFGRRHHDRDIHWFEESTRKQSSEKFRLGMSLCDCTLCSR